MDGHYKKRHLPAFILPDRHKLSDLRAVKKRLRAGGLATVCEEARCPNIGYCFSRPTATFMILGNRCRRGCRFCAVEQGEQPPPEPAEPEKVAEAAAEMGLRHVVITSVTRDDLPDGGAAHFAAVIEAVRRRLPQASIEVLTPDFQGEEAALRTVLNAQPDVFNHNVETVPRLYPLVRPRADYRRSLNLLAAARRLAPAIRIKSGLMAGLGETVEEVIEVLKDLKYSGVDTVTVGQYLQPTRRSLAVVEYHPPEFFQWVKSRAEELGLTAACGPLVRSSFEADIIFRR